MTCFKDLWRSCQTTLNPQQRWWNPKKTRTATLRFFHIGTEIHSALCIHIFGDDFGGFYDTTRLCTKIHLQKTNMKPQNCWFADVSSKVGEFSGPFFRFHICLFSGCVFQHKVKAQVTLDTPDIQILRTLITPMPWFNSCWGHLEADHQPHQLIMEVVFVWIRWFVESTSSRGEKNIKKLQEAPKKRLHITEVPNQRLVWKVLIAKGTIN